MITIIFAPPRKGKTVYMTHRLNCLAFDRERTKNMNNELALKNANGFNLSLQPHCVSANYDVCCRKFGYSKQYSRKINPYRLGFSNDYVKTHFNLPYEAIGITEAQKYLNSRMSVYFPEWQSRWYEQHGHNHLDIFLDTQRPMLIDVNIRELAEFIEIINLDIKYNSLGKISKLIWKIRKIANSKLFDKYISSGGNDSSLYTEETVVADYDVFTCYDSYSCKPKFYDGHIDEDFDVERAKEIGKTKQDYIKYLEENDDELPKKYYQRRKLS